MNEVTEPLWLSVNDVLALHEKLLAVFGGAVGGQDKALLESELARPRNLFMYEGADFFALAASYADAIVNNHAFVDGNKRTGFIAAALFLESNGYKFNAPEVEAVTMTLGLASKTVSAAQHEQWLRENTDS